MTVFNIVGAGIFTAVLAMVMREFKKEYAVLIGCAGGILILLWSLAELSPVLDYIRTLASIPTVAPYFSVVMKALGIGFLTQTGADLCRDTGESSIASKVEFAGKVAILVICLPTLRSVVDLSLSVLGG